jgi:hypothetical protein
MTRKTRKVKKPTRLPMAPLAEEAYRLMRCKDVGTLVSELNSLNTSELQSAVVDLVTYAGGLCEALEERGLAPEMKRARAQGA